MPVATSKAASIVSTTPEKITHLTPPMMKSLEEKKGLADADVVKCEKNLADESKAYQEAKEAAEKAKMDKENAKKTAMEDNKDVDPNEDSDNEYHLTRTVQIEKNIVIDVAADGTETETCTENEVVTEKWEIIHHEHDGDHHEETVAAKSLYEGCTKVAKIAAKEEEAAANAAAAHLKDAEKALAEARSAFAAAEKILAAEKEEMRLAQEELEAAQKLAADLAAQLAAATEQSAADEKASEELLALIKEVRDNQSKDAKTLCAIVIKLEVCIDITCSAHMTVLAEASVEELMVSIKVATDDKALIAACVAVIAKCKQAAENLEGEEKATLAEIHDLLDKIKRNPDASPEEMSAWINDLGALLDVENPKHQNLLEKAGCKDLMQKIKDNTDDENVKAACDGVIAKCDEAEKAAEEALKAKQESNKELKAAIDLVRDNQDADPKELAKMIEAMADMIDVNCHDHAFILDHELAKELLESIMENTDDEDLKAACKKALGLVSEAKDNEHEREAADKAAIRELIHKIETNPDASPEEMAKWVHELTDLLDAENPAHQDILAESNCKDLMQKIKDNTDDEILKAACDEAIEICEEAEKEAAEAAAAAEKEVEELLAAINAVKDNKDADAKTLTPLVKTLADLIDASSHGQFTVLEGEHVKSLIDDIKRNTDDEDLLAACDAVLEKLNLSEKHAAEAEEDMLEGINALLDEIEAKKDTATPEELAAMCHALKDLIDEDNSNVADLLDKRNVKDLMQDIIDNTDDEYLKAAAGGVIEKCDEAAAHAAEELKAQQESNKELKAAIDLVRDNQDADPKELAKMVAAMEDLIDVNCHDHAFILDHELARELLESIMENTEDEDLKAACQKCLDKVVEAKDNEHERETKDKNAIRELIHQIESNPDASPEQMAKWIHKLVDLVDTENPAHQDILAETNCKDLVQKVMDNTDDEYSSSASSDDGVHEGGYRDGERHGHWKTTYADGRLDEGEYIAGKRHGHWKETLASGTVSEGEYRDDKTHGHWMITHFFGTVEEGEYRDGERQGHWKETCSTGTVHEGEYRDGERQGHWKITRDDGTVEEAVRPSPAGCVYTETRYGERHGHSTLPSTRTEQPGAVRTEEENLMFRSFVTTLYEYLINRTLEECTVEDVDGIFMNFLTCDIILGKHCVRSDCIKANWKGYIFRIAPCEKGQEDSMTPLLYMSKNEGPGCEYPNCACKTTQGHLRWTKSPNDNLLEVFTFDWQHHEVLTTFSPIGLDHPSFRSSMTAPHPTVPNLLDGPLLDGELDDLLDDLEGQC